MGRGIGRQGLISQIIGTITPCAEALAAIHAKTPPAKRQPVRNLNIAFLLFIPFYRERYPC
jgi:hypothetical protein